MKKYLLNEITVILVIKLVAIIAIKLVFFGPDTKASNDADSTASAVLERTGPSQRNNPEHP